MNVRHAVLASALVLAALAAGCPGRKPVEGPAPPPPVTPTAAAGPREHPSWSQAGSDAGRTGSTNDPGPESLPGILWSSLVTENVVSEPIRATGPSGELVLVGSGEDVLALDAGTGRTAWRFPVHSLVNAAPMPVGSTVFAAGSDGVGYLLSLADGKEIKKLEFDFVLESSPLRVNDLVLFEETSFSSQAPTSLLHALVPATGEIRWKYEYPNGASSMAATDGTRAFIATSDGIRACSLADGKEAWFYETPKHITSFGPCVRGGHLLYVRGGMTPWDADCIDAATGKLVWTAKLPGRGCAAIALSDKHVLLPMLDGSLARIALADGAVEAPIAMPGRVEARPAVGAHRIYVGAGKMVVAFDKDTLREAWRLELAGQVAWVTIAGDKLLVARLDGFLDCLGS